MKSFRSTGLFAVLVLGFAGYVYFFEYVQEEKDKKVKEAAKLILSWEESDFSSIEINKKTAGRILLSKEGENWLIKSPVQDLAHQSAVKKIISTLKVEKPELVIENSQNLKEFGLEKPQGVMSVESKVGEKVQVSFGTVKSYDGDPYILKDTEKDVFLASKELAGVLEKNVSELRDKRVFREKFDDLSKVNFINSSFSLTRSSRKWNLDGVDYPVSQAEMDSFISDLKELSVIEYVVEKATEKDKRKYKLSEKSRKIELWFGEKRVDLNLSKKGEEFFANTNQREIIGRVESRLVDQLKKNTGDFKDKRYPFLFSKEKLVKVSLQLKGKTTELVKNDSNWAFADIENKKKDFDAQKFDQFLKDVEALEAHRFLSVKEFPAKKLENQMIFYAKDGLIQLKLSWGKPFELIEAKDKKEVIQVKSPKSQETLAVSSESMKKIETYEFFKAEEKDKK